MFKLINYGEWPAMAVVKVITFMANESEQADSQWLVYGNLWQIIFKVDLIVVRILWEATMNHGQIVVNTG